MKAITFNDEDRLAAYKEAVPESKIDAALEAYEQSCETTKFVTKYNIPEDILFWGFGVELRLINGSIHSQEDLIKVVDNMPEEEFKAAMEQLEISYSQGAAETAEGM